MKNLMPTTALNKLIEWLGCHELSQGVGDELSACSIAAINIALGNGIHDKIPECMSPTIGQWIIVIQDAMPEDVRNEAEYKALLPSAAGTGRIPADEQERQEILIEWIFDVVLATLQPIADVYDFAVEWKDWLAQRDEETLRKLREAIRRSIHQQGDEYNSTLEKLQAMINNVETLLESSNKAHFGNTAGSVVSHASSAASYDTDFWNVVDVCGVLEAMIWVGLPPVPAPSVVTAEEVIAANAS